MSSRNQSKNYGDEAGINITPLHDPLVFGLQPVVYVGFVAVEGTENANLADMIEAVEKAALELDEKTTGIVGFQITGGQWPIATGTAVKRWAGN